MTKNLHRTTHLMCNNLTTPPPSVKIHINYNDYNRVLYVSKKKMIKVIKRLTRYAWVNFN